MGVGLPELVTPRLRLRQFRDSDCAQWAAITGDAETMRFLGHGRAYSAEDVQGSLGYMRAHWTIHGFGLWAAEERATGALVGRIGLYRPEGWPGLEVGWLVERSRRGQGLATEGARAALDCAFQSQPVDRVISVIQPENRASLRVAEKLGERFRESRWIAGRRVSIYALDRHSWLSFRGAHPQPEAR